MRIKRLQLKRSDLFRLQARPSKPQRGTPEVLVKLAAQPVNEPNADIEFPNLAIIDVAIKELLFILTEDDNIETSIESVENRIVDH